MNGQLIELQNALNNYGKNKTSVVVAQNLKEDTRRTLFGMAWIFDRQGSCCSARPTVRARQRCPHVAGLSKPLGGSLMVFGESRAAATRASATCRNSIRSTARWNRGAPAGALGAQWHHWDRQCVQGLRRRWRAQNGRRKSWRTGRSACFRAANCSAFFLRRR